MDRLPRRCRERLSAKRMIFTITTGRSGTQYLAWWLKRMRNVSAYHEPPPGFHTVMREVQQNPGLAFEYWLYAKLPRIAACRNDIYAETSHVFCKGFVEPLLDIGFVPDVILLSRPKRQVAQSMYRLNTIPGRTEQALKWYLAPEDPGVLRLESWRDLHDYQLCYWYCLEIERRQAVYGEMLAHRGARVVSLSFSELFTRPGFEHLVEELALPGFSAVNRLRFNLMHDKRINSKKKDKAGTARPSLHVEEMQELEEALIERHLSQEEVA